MWAKDIFRTAQGLQRLSRRFKLVFVLKTFGGKLLTRHPCIGKGLGRRHAFNQTYPLRNRRHERHRVRCFRDLWDPTVREPHESRAVSADAKKRSQAEIDRLNASAFANGVAMALEHRLRRGVFAEPILPGWTATADPMPGPESSGYAFASSFFQEELAKGGYMESRLRLASNVHQIVAFDEERYVFLTKIAAYLQTAPGHRGAQAYGVGAALLTQVEAQILQTRPFGILEDD